MSIAVVTAIIRTGRLPRRTNHSRAPAQPRVTPRPVSEDQAEALHPVPAAALQVLGVCQGHQVTHFEGAGLSP